MTYDPPRGEHSARQRLQQIARERGWSADELARRTEAARIKILRRQLRGQQLANPTGLGISLVATMSDEEVAETLALGRPKTDAQRAVDALRRTDETLERLRRERLAAQAQIAEATLLERHAPEDQDRWRKVKRRSFNEQAVRAARARLLPAEFHEIPEPMLARIRATSRTEEVGDGDE